MDNKIHILCAAIWVCDDKIYEHQPKNIETGYVVCGRRHHNCFYTIFSLCGKKPSVNIKQGFITSDDRFVNRKEAFKIACDANQIINNIKGDSLISEDLY